MPTNVSFFRHDVQARHDKRLIRICTKYGNAGYGVYFKLLEIMGQEDLDINDLDVYSKEVGETVEFLVEFVNYCLSIGLFEQDVNIVYSRRMNEFKQAIHERSFNAAKAAEKRWKK